MSFVLVTYTDRNDVNNSFGVLKISDFEEQKEMIAKLFEDGNTIDSDNYSFESYDAWHDCFEVHEIAEAAAKNLIKTLSLISEDYDTDYVYLYGFRDAIDLESLDDATEYD